jgi:hypothetical protein
MSELQVLVRPEGLGKLKKFIHLIGSRTRDLPACSILSSNINKPRHYLSPNFEFIILPSDTLWPTQLTNNH